MIGDQPAPADRRWTEGVRLVLDFAQPLEVLRQVYPMAAELAVMRRIEVPWVMPAQTDSFGGE